MTSGPRSVLVLATSFLCAAGLVGARSAPAAEALPRRADAPPRESYPGVEVLYDAVSDAQGHRLRLVVSRPAGGPGRYPAIFVVGWLSCDSVEAPRDTRDASGRVFQALAVLPGFVTVRLDKPGVGDSEGVCRETDFATELAGYRAAFRGLARYDFIDPDRVFLLGISNGGGIAPLVAGDAPVRGYVIDGGWVKTWFEHMMEIER